MLVEIGDAFQFRSILISIECKLFSRKTKWILYNVVSNVNLIYLKVI